MDCLVHQVLDVKTIEIHPALQFCGFGEGQNLDKLFFLEYSSLNLLTRMFTVYGILRIVMFLTPVNA